MTTSKRRSKGFKNLLPELPLLPNDYPKPQRKATMEAIFRTDLETQAMSAVKAKQALSTISNLSKITEPGAAISIGVNLGTVKKHHKNPLASAIDNTFVPNTRLQMLRKPIRLPPSYKKKLESVSHLQKKFKDEERKRMKEVELQMDAMVQLEFMDNINLNDDQMSQLREDSKAPAILEPIEMIDDELQIYDTEVDLFIPSAENSISSPYKIESFEGSFSGHLGPVPISTKSTNLDVNSNHFDLPVPDLPPNGSTMQRTLGESFSTEISLRRAGGTFSGDHSVNGNINRRVGSTVSRELSISPIPSNQKIVGPNIPEKSFLDNLVARNGTQLSKGTKLFEESGDRIGGDKKRPNTNRLSVLGGSRIPSMASLNPAADVDSFENLQAKNVPYMLQIWERAEGISINELLGKGKGAGIKPRLSSQYSDILSETSVKSVESSCLSDDLVTNGLLADHVAHFPNISTQKPALPEPNNTISYSTLELLNKFSKASANSEEFIDVSAEDHVIRVLTGHQVTNRNDPSGINTPSQPDYLEGMIKQRRKHTSPFKNITPGSLSRVIGEYITDNGEIIEHNQKEKMELVSDKDFGFELPNKEPIVEKRKSLSVTLFGKVFPPETSSIEIAQEISDRLKNILGHDVAVPALDFDNNPNALFKSIKKSDEHTSNKETINSSNSFSLKRFGTLLKTSSGDLELTENEKDLFAKCIEISVQHLPSHHDLDSKDLKDLIAALIICIRQESELQIRHEAGTILLQLGEESRLGRWDRMTFRQLVDDIMDVGMEHQKDVVALYYVKIGKVDTRVVRQIKIGLGDLDRNKSDMTVDILSNLDIKFADYVIKMCEEDSQKSNWRVRYDVISVLRAWIPRITPPEKPPPPPRDPDALETDDDAMVKALFNTLGKTTTVKSTEEKVVEAPIPEDLSMDEILELKESVPLQPNIEIQIPAASKSNTSLATLTAEEVQEREALCKQAVHVLLNLMWTDWSAEVREAATNALSELKQGRPVFDWVVSLLESEDPVKRVDALKCIAFLGVMVHEKLPIFEKCFKDPYTSVKIEACKVACILRSPQQGIVRQLLDLLENPEFQARAYAIKALGLSTCTDGKTRECLNWALQHDTHPAVRAEAVRAVYNLGLINEDQSIKNGVMTLMTTDSSDKVKKEAERVLVLAGVIFPNINNSEDNSEMRIKVDGTQVKPYPHILGDKTTEEVEIYLRQSLITEKEQQEVINQVRNLTTQDQMLDEVTKLEAEGEKSIVEGLDLDQNSIFIVKMEAEKQIQKRLQSAKATLERKLKAANNDL
ncbi:HEAT repeat-containing protein 4 [Globomyces sp. JEL0801]|nr:HEAT repeat-containing protein 4 [Globomyces sp. JEL0801]